MPSKDKEVLNKNAAKHYNKIKDDPEVRRKARERAAAWYAANKEKVKQRTGENKKEKAEYMKNWRAKNRDHINKYKVKNQRSNKKATYARIKKYHCTEKGKLSLALHRDIYRARTKEASLKMYDAKAMADIYRSCKLLTRTTGIKYEVDHIIPIVHEKVSGLHVSWNMQIMKKEENRKKSNKLDPKE